jgi:cysteinyl-tRNA synthetase
MEAGARVEVAPYKKGPMDFVLWKPSKPGEPAWPSPCGIAAPGRPGWHIECSAMAERWLWQEPQMKGLLSDAGLARPHVFDIHGGGIDLVFPHHENEIAQSRCGHGTAAMANVWMHNGFLQVEGEKMSKSLGNFVTINELLETTNFFGHRWQGEVIRIAMLMTHYRQPINWTHQKLIEAIGALQSFGVFAKGHKSTNEGLLHPGFLVALQDDLNTPAALAELHGLLGEIRSHNVQDERKDAMIDMLANSLRLIGITKFFTTPEQEELETGADPEKENRIADLIAARNAARQAKDFKEADRIRGELDAMGIQLKDSKDPATGTIKTTWEVKR